MKTKKSMFITTILMVAVLIVAVSTATFAWYTATGATTASEAKITSAQSSEANISIGWEANAKTPSITFVNGADGLKPMAPKTALEKGVTTFDAFKANLYSSTLDLDGKFNSTPSTAETPWLSNGTGATDNKFYIINNNVNSAENIKMTMTQAAYNDNAETTDVDESINNNSKVVVAVFVEGYLAGVFAPGGSFVYGTITQGDAYEDLDDEVNVNGNDDLIVDEIVIELDAATSATAGTAKFIQVVAWLDGEDLTQTYAGYEANFSFNFERA